MHGTLTTARESASPQFQHADVHVVILGGHRKAFARAKLRRPRTELELELELGRGGSWPWKKAAGEREGRVIEKQSRWRQGIAVRSSRRSRKGRGQEGRRAVAAAQKSKAASTLSSLGVILLHGNDVSVL